MKVGLVNVYEAYVGFKMSQLWALTYCLKGNKVFLAGRESPAEVGEEERPGSEAIFLSRWGCRVAFTSEIRAV